MPGRVSGARGEGGGMRAAGAASVDRDHHAGRLDDRISVLALLELELVDRLVGDRGRDHVAAADIEADMRGRLSLRHLDDLALEVVAGAGLHDVTPWVGAADATPLLGPGNGRVEQRIC